MDTQEQSAIITDIGRPDKDGKCKLSVKYLKRDGTPLDFPTAYQGVPDTLLKDFNPGDQVTVTTKKGRPKDNVKPENQGDERKAFWWDFSSLRKGSAPAPAPVTTTGRDTDADLGWQLLYSQERQVALKAAVELSIAAVTPVDLDAVLEVARAFAAFLAATPEQQAPAATEGGAEPAAALAPVSGEEFAAWCKEQNIDRTQAANLLGAPGKDLKAALGNRSYAEAKRDMQKALDEMPF